MRKKPMLAYPVNNKPVDYSKTVFMQPKLDGVRCLIQAEKLPFDMFMEQSRNPKTNTEEQLLGELASLMTQLNLHQEKEEYEKCAELKKKIDELRKKINKL